MSNKEGTQYLKTCDLTNLTTIYFPNASNVRYTSIYVLGPRYHLIFDTSMINFAISCTLNFTNMTQLGLSTTLLHIGNLPEPAWLVHFERSSSGLYLSRFLMSASEGGSTLKLNRLGHLPR